MENVKENIRSRYPDRQGIPEKLMPLTLCFHRLNSHATPVA
jgi:hypothetical protein